MIGNTFQKWNVHNDPDIPPSSDSERGGGGGDFEARMNNMEG